MDYIIRKKVFYKNNTELKRSINIYYNHVIIKKEYIKQDNALCIPLFYFKGGVNDEKVMEFRTVRRAKIKVSVKKLTATKAQQLFVKIIINNLTGGCFYESRKSNRLGRTYFESCFI